MPSPIRAVPIRGLAHLGVRVHDLERSLRFYSSASRRPRALWGPSPVAILSHPSGVERNLILNAPSAVEPNILVDIPQRHAGITHFALLCDDVLAAKAALESAGIALSGGPMKLGPSALAIFVRDPDANVIELHQRLAGSP